MFWDLEQAQSSIIFSIKTNIMKKIRETHHNKIIGINRIMLGVIFSMTGIMKIAFEQYGAAWSVQLLEAEIPLYTFTYWFIPILEIIIGITLLLGYYSRLGALMALPIMLVGIYVHLTVTNPAAFPAQPQQPVMPVIIILMSAMTLMKGGGSWSKDLEASLNSK